jgi:hypothetical protein
VTNLPWRDTRSRPSGLKIQHDEKPCPPMVCRTRTMNAAVVLPRNVACSSVRCFARFAVTERTNTIAFSVIKRR